jgi:tetratricopeptide (TPR) repeat protein
MKVSRKLLLGLCLAYVCLPIGLSSNDGLTTALLEKAQGKLENESYQEASDLFNNAKNLDPMQVDAWYGAAESDYHLNKYKECDETCDKVLRDKSFEGIGGLDRFAELSGKCTIAYKKATGKDLVNMLKPDQTPEAYQQAREYYYLALALNSNSTSAWNSLGMLEAELGNYTGSISCFDGALEINSSLAYVWNNKGASLANLGRYEESLGCLDNATRLNPNFAEAWYNKVKTLGKLKDEALAKGKALDPELAGKIQFGWIMAEIS